MKTVKVKVSDLKSGPILQEILPKGFIERVIKFKEILKEVETMSIEETVSNFQRDEEPEKELLVWENIAYLYEKEAKSRPRWSPKQRKEAFRLLLSASLGN